MKTGMVLSLAANVALVVSLGIVSRSANKRVAETTAEDMKECGQAVKTVVKIGYLGGCMTAISETKHVEQGDPLIPVYMDYCMQGAQAIAEKIEMK